jgi:ATP-binding cassette subfamily B protein
MEYYQVLDKLKWLWDYYRDFKPILFLLIFLTPVQIVFQVSIPRMIDFTIDYLDTGVIPSDKLALWLTEVGNSVSFAPAMTFGLGFVLLGLISSILYFIVQSRRAKLNLNLEWMFRQKTFNKITSKGPDFFNRFRTGDIITRLTDDVSENMKLSWFACSGIFRFYEALLMIGFSVAMMITIDPMLTLWAVGPLPILIIIFFISDTALHKRFSRLQEKISIFNDIIEACFTGIRVVKAYVREKAQKDKFETAAVKRRQAEIDAIKMHSVIESLYYYIWQMSIIIIIIAGGYFVMNADLSRGKLASFIFYTVWLVFPMFDIGQFLVKLRQSNVLIDRLMELERVTPMVLDNGNEKLDGNLKGDLEFTNIKFRFPGQSSDIIDNISLNIKKGSTVALVGKVGSGKSWLINLLPRLVDPSGGEISVNGVPLKKFKLEDLRIQIGYVPQEPTLFSDSIRNNILMGRQGISDEVLSWALDIAQFRSEVDEFPDKLETFIGTRGMSISGGQKQRLALARALVGKPSLLILDDCTSALDSDTESALWDRLHEVLPEMTAIIITHRPDTLERADNIFVLDEGRLIETGTHDELIKNEKGYARIYKRYQLEESVR